MSEQTREGTLPAGGSSMRPGKQVKKVQVGNPGSGGPGNTTTPATKAAKQSAAPSVGDPNQRQPVTGK